MNKENAKEYLPLLQALADGEMIQFNQNTFNEPCWIDVDRILSSNPAQCYRIKPKPRDIWIVEHSDGSMSGPTFSAIDALLGQAHGSTLRRYREVIE